MTNSAVRALGAGLALLALLSACASAPAVREEDERARIAREGPQATLDRAKALYDEGEGERAQAILEILLASPSGRKVEPEILFAIGRIEFERGRYDAAAARLDRGLRDYPNSDAAFETQWLLARVHTRRGHPELSVPLLKSLRRQGLTDGEKGRLNQDFAEAYEVAGNPMTALWWYQRADPLLATEAEREDARERVRRIVEEKLSPEQLPEVAYLYRDNLIGDLASERLAALRAEPATPLYDMTGSPAADYTLPTGPVEGAIGVILPLTGPQASYGARLLRAVLLAGGAFRADDDGPIVELVLKDSKGTAEGAARAARALADDERVAAIVGPVVPAAAQSAAEVAESAGVPMITLTPAAGVTAVGP
ncbi:MAG: ABC transporter substrate-binding protein, partial [Myxococcales bacterium]|nr:ABC transporter substrate-binding protein [Myxococcales bacterium]